MRIVLVWLSAYRRHHLHIPRACSCRIRRPIGRSGGLGCAVTEVRWHRARRWLSGRPADDALDYAEVDKAVQILGASHPYPVQVADKRYLSEGSIARLNTPPTSSKKVATPALLTA